MAIDLNSILSLLQDDGTPEHWAGQLPGHGRPYPRASAGWLVLSYTASMSVTTRSLPLPVMMTTIPSIGGIQKFGQRHSRNSARAATWKYASIRRRNRSNSALCRKRLPLPGLVWGNKKYDLLFHNCEHFANACKLGVYRSHQTEDILFGKAIPKALECLGDDAQRNQWLQDAWRRSDGSGFG